MTDAQQDVIGAFPGAAAVFLQDDYVVVGGNVSERWQGATAPREKLGALLLVLAEPGRPVFVCRDPTE